MLFINLKKKLITRNQAVNSEKNVPWKNYFTINKRISLLVVLANKHLILNFLAFQLCLLLSWKAFTDRETREDNSTVVFRYEVCLNRTGFQQLFLNRILFGLLSGPEMKALRVACFQTRSRPIFVESSQALRNIFIVTPPKRTVALLCILPLNCFSFQTTFLLNWQISSPIGSVDWKYCFMRNSVGKAT